MSNAVFGKTNIELESLITATFKEVVSLLHNPYEQYNLEATNEIKLTTNVIFGKTCVNIKLLITVAVLGYGCCGELEVFVLNGFSSLLNETFLLA